MFIFVFQHSIDTSWANVEPLQNNEVHTEDKFLSLLLGQSPQTIKEIKIGGDWVGGGKYNKEKYCKYNSSLLQVERILLKNIFPLAWKPISRVLWFLFRRCPENNWVFKEPLKIADHRADCFSVLSLRGSY